MKHFLHNLVLNFWPIGIILLIVFFLFLINYQSVTFLTGWDNLHPELSFGTNIQRSIFAVWQEYQGLGLLGGMGHASDLVHQIILYLLSFILPIQILRYFWTFLMLFTGSAGTYFLIRFICHPEKKIIAFLGSLFYLLNLATIQMFYAPFEAFITHYAFLPWLLLSLMLFLHQRNRSSVVFTAIIAFLATPAAYIPTLFVAYLLASSIIICAFLLTTKKVTLLVGKYYLLIFLINAFWLMPFLYFTATNASVNLNAKINQMATETIFLQNKEFGNIQDVMLLKGFWLNNVDPNTNGVFTYMMLPWKEHLSNPLIPIIGYVLFTIVLFGVFKAVRTKKPLLLGFVALFVFSVTMLATDTFPFSWFDIIFRKIPLFNQAFRFPFTKFSILTALTYSIFFAIGIQTITSLLKGRILLLSYLISLISLVIFTLPAFQGHLFYEKERLSIPKEYFELFDFFKKQDQNTRIANFPQTSFWGWNFERWGYGGSGFLWYGIKQPILDRAFDVWSKENENYYFETSHAVYGKNTTAFEKVLNKYQVTWLLIDKNIINPSAPKSLFFRPLAEMISQIPNIKKAATFGNIDVYKVTLADNPKNFVFLTSNLPTVNSYNTGELDQAYIDHKNYISTSHQLPATNNYFYPFRTFFSNKLQKNISYSIKESYEDITFSTIIQPNNKQTTLSLPSLVEKETLVPAELVVRKKNNQITLDIQIPTPQVFLDNQNIFGTSIKQTLFTIKPNTRFPLTLHVNGIATYTIRDENEYITRTFVATKTNNSFVLQDTDGQRIQSQILPASFLATAPQLLQTSLPIIPHPKPIVFTIKIRKINDGFIGKTIRAVDFPHAKNCDNFRNGEAFSMIQENTLLLSAKNATSCTSISLDSLPHQQGYALFIPHKNISGRPLHFWILNDQQEFSPIDTYLNTNNDVDTFILSSQDDFNKGYSLHFDSMSIGTMTTKNTLGEASLYPVPYQYLTSLAITNRPKKEAPVRLSVLTTHPNESLYTVSFNKIPPTDTTLVLSQGYNSGWKAYQVSGNTWFPFLFGKELKNHVLVNNWANGWLLDNYNLQPNTYSLVILFLPQYLEYLGFVLLIGVFLWFLALFLHQKLTKN